MSGEPGFVTVAEAARALGIGERRAYRLSDKLSDSDKKTSDTGRRTVRQSALALLCGHSLAAVGVSDTPSKPSDNGAQLSDSVSKPFDAALVAGVAEERRRADVAEARALLLEGERDRLAAALSESQATARAALEALREEQGRASVLIAATARSVSAQGRFIEAARTEGGGENRDGGIRHPMMAGEPRVPHDGGVQDRPAAFTGDTDSGDSGEKAQTPAPTQASGFWGRIFKGKEKGVN